MQKDDTRRTKFPFLNVSAEAAFMAGFSSEIGNRLNRLRERYLPSENVLHFNHGRHWEAPANELGEKAGTMDSFGAESQLNLSDITNYRTNAIFDIIDHMTSALNAEFERLMIDTLSSATEKSGQIVSAAGRSKAEAMYEMIEKMELSLDKDGELSMPSLIANQQVAVDIMSQLEKTTPEFEDRLNSLKARKKKEAQEREVQRLARFDRRST